MARLSVNEMTTYCWTFEQDVERYRSAGIEAIGVWRRKLSDYGDERGIELLHDNGLAASNLLWAGGFTGSDVRSFRECIADAVEAIRLAAAMRAGCLVVYSGGRAGHTQNHAMRILTDALTELDPVAAHYGVTLAVEPMHPACSRDWTFLNTADAAVDMIEQFASPRVKLAFDTYHLCHDRAILAQIPRLVKHIAVVHLGDSRGEYAADQDRCPLGEGTLPLAETVAALLAAGYDGDFDVELIGEEIEACDNAQLLEQSRDRFEQMLHGSKAAG